MDFENINAAAFGRALGGLGGGLGLNILVRNVAQTCRFLVEVFDMAAHQQTPDFAILTYGDQVFQVHADATYHSNPLLSLLPETGARGAGIELRLYNSDPDECVARVRENFPAASILQPPMDKPHGLREAYILCADGYAWVPSRPLPIEKRP